VEYVLYGIFFISCIVLVGTVLLQPGKTDAGALFTNNISSSAFAPRGTQTILSKITIGAATVFMLSALMLAMPAITGDGSVLSGSVEEEVAPVEESQVAFPSPEASQQSQTPAAEVSPAASPSAK
jgi:preprotein translocase subunit SecG